MLKYLTICFIFCIGILHAQQKRALVITIGDYPDIKDGWNDLHSANDAKLMEATLLASGFDKTNITHLQDKAATKKGIEKAFINFTSTCTPGDFIIIHFSCHGQQIEDLNGDEPDGLDEAIVGYNAPMRFPSNGKYKFEEHVCDDELGIWINQIQKAIGKNGQILVNIDACHSGSATRGDDAVRGDAEPCVSPNFVKKDKPDTKNKGFSVENKTTTNADNGEGKLVVISGSRAQESCYETKDEDGTKVGTLTLAFCQSFVQADSNTTYHLLFTRIMTIMAGITLRQTPTLEGDVDYKIFNGKLVQQKPYYELVDKRDDTILVVNAGSMANINLGDRIGFYDPYSKYSLNNPEISGTVTKVNPFFSEVTLDKYVYIENLKSYWGGTVEKSLTGLVNTFHIDIKSKSLRDSITKNLSGYALIQFNDQMNTGIIKEGKLPNTIQIIEKSTGFALTKNLEQVDITQPGAWNNILAEMKSYAQSRFIREITMEDDDIQIEAELWPVKDVEWADEKKRTFSKFTYDTTYYFNANREYDPNRQYVLKIKNTGKKDCYISAIEIQPDDIINILLPYQNADASSYKLKPGEEKTWLHIRRFTEPFGTEVFKVFATSSVINLRSIVQSKGSATKGDMQTMELLLNDSYMGTRGDSPSGFDANNSGTIKSIVFEVR